MRQILRKVVRRIAGLPYSRKYTSLTLGKAVTLDSNLEINAGRVSIGDYSYTGAGRISSLPETNITIGKFASIAAGVQIVGALHKSHITNYSLTRLLTKEESKLIEHGVSRGDVVIGNDVWIGLNAIVMSGVTIGDGAVIGAGAVVTESIPPYAVAVGSPAKVKKYRFTAEEIDSLLEAKWWDWEFEKIKRNLPSFYDSSMSVQAFLLRAEQDNS